MAGSTQTGYEIQGKCPPSREYRPLTVTKFVSKETLTARKNDKCFDNNKANKFEQSSV